MTHSEHHDAAATLVGELAATRAFLDRLAHGIALLKDRTATLLLTPHASPAKRSETDADIYDDLYFPDARTFGR
jgi:hypothetical protein